MRWYRIAQPVQVLPDGNLQIDVATVPASAWQAVNDYMVEHGYDWHGAEDAKAVFERLAKRMGNIFNKALFPDHVAALLQAVGSKPKPKPEKIPSSFFTKVVRHFGYTNDLSEAGYILPNGGLLDFSGKREGGQFGTRARDHREIGMATGEGGTEGMIDFILKGAIRFMPETGFLHIGRMPTEQQFNRILDVFRQHRVREEGTIVTLQRAPGVSRDFEYQRGTNPAYIINDIRKFYG